MPPVALPSSEPAGDARSTAPTIEATAQGLLRAYRFGRYRIEGAVYNLFDSQKFTSIKPGKTVPYDQYYFQPERNFQVSLKVNF